MKTSRTSILAVVTAGLTFLAPVAVLAQSQLAEELRPQLIELGMESSEVEALDSASEEQLTRIEAVVEGEGDEMTKQDEISAILAEGE